MKRIIAALVIALPLAWIATGFADHSGCKPDGIGMCLLAPGLTLVLKNAVPFGHPSNWLNAVARAGTTALSVTLAYYTALSYGLLANVRRCDESHDCGHC
jgi:hypothetical protein